MTTLIFLYSTQNCVDLSLFLIKLIGEAQGLLMVKLYLAKACVQFLDVKVEPF